jgi:hypothetical protein
VLEKIFEIEKEAVAGGWRRLHNEVLHNLYSSPNIVRMIKLRRKGWVDNVVRKAKLINA